MKDGGIESPPRAHTVMRFAIGLLATVIMAAAAPQDFVSAPTRTHVVELFTSEGCSSCPPAEAWLATLRQDRALWHDFVPIAWHVDYWDRLGWKDRFASQANTARQYAYAAAWHSDTVYTPCFVLDGNEWRGRELPAHSDEPAGVLRATYDEGNVTVRYQAMPTKLAAASASTYEAHAVLLAMDVASKVTAGENSGRELRHHFVAGTPVHTARLRNGETRFELRPAAPANGSSFALAVWITTPGDLTPRQAVGGELQSR